jgi:flavin reductase (DIM6/NTAB) family NADH-FMN oxidoreductase RutF
MKESFDATEYSDEDIYKLLIGLVVPRPIGWIGSKSPDGVRNLAPFSFFNAVAASPPTVIFSTIRRHGHHKDTLANVAATGVFTVNIVTEEVVDAMNVTAGSYGPEVDEFEISGLTPVPGSVVDAPMVAESKANFECRLSQIVPIGENGPMAASIVIGEILRAHVDGAILDGTRVDQTALRAVGRMGGPLYTHTRDLFQLERPN